MDWQARLLVGDALFAKAFELLAEQAHLSPPDCVAQVLQLIATASGVHGMRVGQVRYILLDDTAPTEQLDKPADSDHARNKATYTALFGTEQARAHAQHAMQDALNTLPTVRQSR